MFRLRNYLVNVLFVVEFDIFMFYYLSGYVYVYLDVVGVIVGVYVEVEYFFDVDYEVGVGDILRRVSVGIVVGVGIGEKWSVNE